MNELIWRWQRLALRGTEGGEPHLGQRSWSNICASRSWSSDMSGTPCWEFKVHGETLGQQADLEHVIRQREGNTNCRGFGMRCECWAISGMRQSTPTLKVQCVQSNCTGCDPLGFVRFCRPEWELYKEWTLPVESVPEQIGTSTLGNDKEDLGQ